MTAGRPTTYCPELAEKICLRISEGQDLRAIVEDETLPTRSTIYLWLAEHKEFSDHYARARAEQADFHVDEIIKIADDETLTPADKRMRIDARKWHAAKFNERYSDKSTVHTVVSFAEMTDEELKDELAKLEGKD